VGRRHTTQVLPHRKGAKWRRSVLNVYVFPIQMAVASQATQSSCVVRQAAIWAVLCSLVATPCVHDETFRF
jgi:hypothetical protein